MSINNTATSNVIMPNKSIPEKNSIVISHIFVFAVIDGVWIMGFRILDSMSSRIISDFNRLTFIGGTSFLRLPCGCCSPS